MADADQQARRYQYRGDLGHDALPEILYTVYLHRVPGVVECSHGGVLKRVFLRDGAVIHASSTDRQDSLGIFLQGSGRITAEQFRLTYQLRANSPHKRHGELLIEHGILSPQKLYEAIQEQIRSVVWSLFAWDAGEVTFSNFDTGRSNHIEKGSIVSTRSGLDFATQADVDLPNATIQFPFTIVPSTSKVGIEAVDPGPSGNVNNNTITVVPSSLAR